MKGRQVNGISDFFRDGTFSYKSSFIFFNNINYLYLDEIFIASTTTNDIPPTDLQEISLEIVNDPQQPSSRRSQIKQLLHSPVDRDTPNTQIAPTAPITIDVKKAVNIRDSGFLDDEDGLSGRDSELTATRGLNTKQNELASEDAPTSTDLISRKLKSND